MSSGMLDYVSTPKGTYQIEDQKAQEQIQILIGEDEGSIKQRILNETAYLDDAAREAAAHMANKNNPHEVTPEQLGIHEATQEYKGLMSASDKFKLDNIDSGAQKNKVESAIINGDTIILI